MQRGCVQWVWSHLWCNIVRSATEGAGLVAAANTLLTEAKVCNLDVAVGIQHHIVQLQVTVDDAHTVQVQQTQGDLCSVEPAGGVGDSGEEREEGGVEARRRSGWLPDLVWLSEKRPKSRMWNMRSPPLIYSMTKKRCSSVWKQE